MELLFHGGNCCGVKTIKGFLYGPEAKCTALAKKAANNKDKHGHHVSSMETFFTDEAPAETLGDRLDRYLAFLRTNRPRGLVEAYLINSQVMLWDDFLKSRGFTADLVFNNSNSGNNITRYSLVMKPGNKPKASKEKPLTELVAVEEEG